MMESSSSTMSFASRREYLHVGFAEKSLFQKLARSTADDLPASSE
jgi:hypothetical protein